MRKKKREQKNEPKKIPEYLGCWECRRDGRDARDACLKKISPDAWEWKFFLNHPILSGIVQSASDARDARDAGDARQGWAWDSRGGSISMLTRVASNSKDARTRLHGMLGMPERSYVRTHCNPFVRDARDAKEVTRNKTMQPMQNCMTTTTIQYDEMKSTIQYDSIETEDD